MDFVVLELRRRNIPFVRLNCEDLPRAEISFRPQSGWNLVFDGADFALEKVRAAYYRRPGTPEVSDASLDAPTRGYVVGEWAAVLRSLWNALEGRWLSSPFAILRAEDKPRQLEEAVALGFDVPDTLIGNQFDQASAFVQRGDAIGKPLRHALIDRGETGEVLFTSRLAPLTEVDLPAVRVAPVIYQREIRKAHDIRVTIIGDELFAVAIHSQGQPETEVDWRRGNRLDLAHEVIKLPARLAERCIQLTRRLGLGYGAIDFVLDQNGKYWFLEINPNGQWAWIERRTGVPLTKAIVDKLLGIAA